MNTSLSYEEDSVKTHQHSYLDTYWILNNNPGVECPSGTLVQSRDLEYSFETWDHLCQYSLLTEITGNEETKPKNMNVIFIIRVF